MHRSRTNTPSPRRLWHTALPSEYSTRSDCGSAVSLCATPLSSSFSVITHSIPCCFPLPELQSPEQQYFIASVYIYLSQTVFFFRLVSQSRSRNHLRLPYVMSHAFLRPFLALSTITSLPLDSGIHTFRLSPSSWTTLASSPTTPAYNKSNTNGQNNRTINTNSNEEKTHSPPPASCSPRYSATSTPNPTDPHPATASARKPFFLSNPPSDQGLRP